MKPENRCGRDFITAVSDVLAGAARALEAILCVCPCQQCPSACGAPPEVAAMLTECAVGIAPPALAAVAAGGEAGRRGDTPTNRARCRTCINDLASDKVWHIPTEQIEKMGKTKLKAASVKKKKANVENVETDDNQNQSAKRQKINGAFKQSTNNTNTITSISQ